jgi:hypothetical protein
MVAYRADASCHAVDQSMGTTHQATLRYLDRAERLGGRAALANSPSLASLRKSPMKPNPDIPAPTLAK